jgi:hypothetical protein
VLDAGPSPLLYGGNQESGRLLTFMGFGARGIASVGEDDKFRDGNVTPAAAQGLALSNEV